jgi:hypothetical protein
VKSTRYFEDQVLQRRAYLDRAWCERAVSEPEHVQIEPGGRVRYWKRIPEFGGRWLRVVTLEDGETIHNAFPDRRFRLPQAETP